jgi:hypothetical protein
MTVSGDGKIIGALTDPERLARAEEFRKAGFVHVTGLPVIGHLDDLRGREWCIQARSCQLGRTDCNNGKIVVVTPDGEVWLASSTNNTLDFANAFNTEGGAFVPCSNGESVHMNFILERIADPYWNCHGRYLSAPQPRP